MKSIVTGGAGFIGSNLVEKLLNMNHQVIVIDNESAECHEQFYWNNNAENYKYDICNYEKIEPLFKDVDYVFHLASDARIQQAVLNPAKSIQTNAIGTFNVLEASRFNNVKRVIYSSTSSSYGKNNILPNVESQKTDCLTPYSVSKVFGENLCKVYYDLYKLETISLRYFNAYGYRQPLKGQYAPVIGLFLKQFKDNQPLTIVGDGTQKRDFTHIDDVVNANILAMDVKLNSYGEVFNVGYGKNYSILEIAEMISDDVVFIPARPGEAKETLSDTAKIKTQMGWEPKVSLSNWIKSQL